jgi:peptidyl-prolyl cis-trans isomerase SurA
VRSVMLLWLVATPLAAQQPASKPEVADRIIAIVGDSIILKSDIDVQFNQVKQSGQEIPDSAKAYKSLLDNRVNELLIVQAAARDTSIIVDDQQVNAAVQQELDARKRNFGSDEQFNAALRQSGMSLEELRIMLAGDIRTRLLMREYIGKLSRERKAPPVSDNLLKEHFEANRGEFGQRPATISFIQVVISPTASDTARASARAKLEEALKELRAGADFESLAKKYSDDTASRELGGDLGWFRAGRMVREFDQTVFAMRPGEISPIVETSFGFHLIKLEKVRGAERQARHILVIPTITGDDAERMRATADSVGERLRAGVDPDTLVKQYGDPNEQSRVGPFPLDRLPEPYNTALVNAQPGEVVGPVLLPSTAGPSKFALIKITSRQSAGAYSLDDAQFRAQLRDRLAQDRLVEEIIRELRQRTLVEYRI